MCLDEEELTIAIFAILIPTLVASIILYILVMRPLPYEKPWDNSWNKKSGINIQISWIYSNFEGIGPVHNLTMYDLSKTPSPANPSTQGESLFLVKYFDIGPLI